jgi:hypothetical protein
MILYVNGKRVGGMTEHGFGIELDCCGSEITLTVCRYKFPCLLTSRTQNTYMYECTASFSNDAKDDLTLASNNDGGKFVASDRPSSSYTQCPDLFDESNDTCGKEVSVETGITFAEKKITTVNETERSVCDCGADHSKVLSFRLQCVQCKTWLRVSPNCVGMTMEEAQNVNRWLCAGCDECESDSQLPRGNKGNECIENGALVRIREHAWSGVNNEEGYGTVLRHRIDDDGDLVYDIKYIIGRTVKNVGCDYVARHSFE